MLICPSHFTTHTKKQAIAGELAKVLRNFTETMIRSSMEKKTESLTPLADIMRRLRDPEAGCPWDLKQSFETIAPFTIEEAYEVEDAIRRQDHSGLESELGDLLFQVIFMSQLAEENKLFDLDDVIVGICEKMVRRHPHVFEPSATQSDISKPNQSDPASSDDAIRQNWEQIKQAERSAKSGGDTSLLSDLPISLPGLTRAVKVQKRVSRVGFDWEDLEPVFGKIREEIDELSHEVSIGASKQRLTDELGDILFAMANLARHLDVDPEDAIRSTNAKFIKRFQWMETQADLGQLSIDEQEALWEKAKSEA